jgi:hypothetical protein
MDLKYNLQDLVEKIEKNFDISIPQENLPSFKNVSSSKESSENPVYKFNELVKKYLKSLGIKVVDDIISVPNIENVDFTLNVRDIFIKNKEKFKNINECASFLESKLSNWDFEWIDSVERK